MQPYQEASQEIRRQGELPIKALKTAASIAATAGGAKIGGLALNKVMPFLSKYIPEDLAIKGLSKVDPRFGKFINKALGEGFDFNEVKDFIGGKAEEGQENKKEPAKQSKNIIEQESPELHQFIDQEIRKGRKPIEAAALAQNDKRFSGAIQKLMKAHKTPWSSIIESIFGKGNMGLPQQQSSTEEAMNPPGSQLSKDPQAAQTGQQQGNGANAIMQAIQMAAESRKRRQQ